jgi:hypothetical protein
MHDGNEAKERRQLQPNSTHHLVTPQLLAQEVDKLGEAFLAVNLQATSIESGVQHTTAVVGDGGCGGLSDSAFVGIAACAAAHASPSLCSASVWAHRRSA